METITSTTTTSLSLEEAVRRAVERLAAPSIEAVPNGLAVGEVADLFEPVVVDCGREQSVENWVPIGGTLVNLGAAGDGADDWEHYYVLRLGTPAEPTDVFIQVEFTRWQGRPTRLRVVAAERVPEYLLAALA